MQRTWHSVMKCVGITIAFWGMVLLGPGLVILFNNLTTLFSEAGYYEGSIGYKILVFFSQSIGCALAYSVAESISKYDHQICVFVNEIICICFLVLLALSMFFLLNETINGLNYVVATIVTIICSKETVKSITVKG